MGSWERRRRTSMAVNHTPILIYGEDQSLQSIKNKKKSSREISDIKQICVTTYLYIWIFVYSDIKFISYYL